MDKSLGKGLLALEILAESESPIGVTALAGRMGITKSNAHRLLTALVATGYAEPTQPRGSYAPSLKLWRLGARIVARLDVKSIAAPHLARLVAETQETANLSVLDGPFMVYIDRVETDTYIRSYNRIGDRHPAHCTGTGLALLAHAPEETLAQALAEMKPHTPATLTDPTALATRLAQIRRQGYATTRAEFRPGINSIAAPIRGAHDRVVAAIGLSGPADRLKPARVKTLAPLVAATAEKVSRLLGAPAP
jgi:IclR family KDG regulon transcriptional repressor